MSPHTASPYPSTDEKGDYVGLRTSKNPIALLAVISSVALVATIAFASSASAHVTVNPKTADKGGYAKLTFRVPNEKDSASTTKLEINIPTDKPIRSISVQPHEGWIYSIEKTTLAQPIKTDNGDIAEVVSKVTWTSQSNSAIKPGEFDEFNISAGPLPQDVDSIAFKALQTYSDGNIVRWIDVPVNGGEAEHPAPTLTLTAKVTSASTSIPASTASKSDVTGARNVGIAALAIGVIALLASVGTRRRPTS